MSTVLPGTQVKSRGREKPSTLSLPRRIPDDQPRFPAPLVLPPPATEGTSSGSATRADLSWATTYFVWRMNARYPESAAPEIHRRVGSKIPGRTFRRALEKLVNEGAVEVQGERRRRRYYPGSSIGQEDDDGR
jgi:hypothetical protein